jgi:hypothetical protein
MLRADVLTFQTVGFMLRLKQNVLAGLARREIEMGWYNLNQAASNFQLYCESWQVVPGVASGCTRVFLPAPVLI